MEGSRLGNVAGALLMEGPPAHAAGENTHLEGDGELRSTREARLLDQLFQETLLVGGDPDEAAPGRRIPEPEGVSGALPVLACALEAASAERVLVLASGFPLLPADLLLALTAWPERDAVVSYAADSDHPLCAIYRRDPVLPVAREQLAKGELRLVALLDRIDTARVCLAELGLGDLAMPPLLNVDAPFGRDWTIQAEER